MKKFYVGGFVLASLCLFTSIAFGHPHTAAEVEAMRQAAAAASSDAVSAESDCASALLAAEIEEILFDACRSNNASEFTECEDAALTEYDESADDNIGMGGEYEGDGETHDTVALAYYNLAVKARDGISPYSNPDMNVAYHLFEDAKYEWEDAEEDFMCGTCSYDEAEADWYDGRVLMSDSIGESGCVICNDEVCGDSGEGE